MPQLSLRFHDADQDQVPGPQLSGRFREDVLFLMAKAMAYVCRMQGKENHEHQPIFHEDQADAP